MTPFTCDMNHREVPDRLRVADLAGGWHAIHECSICDRRAFTPISRDEKDRLVREELAEEMVEGNRYRAYLKQHAATLQRLDFNVWADYLRDDGTTGDTVGWLVDRWLRDTGVAA